jgi:hypothetical protein
MKTIRYASFTLALILSGFQMTAQNLEEIMGQITDGMTKAEFKPVYTFDTYMQMEITEPGNNKVLYDIILDSKGSAFGAEIREGGAHSYLVFDTENNSLLMLVEQEGEKNGIAMAVDPEAMAEITSSLQESEPSGTPRKTGNTKDILGYPCSEYLVDDGSLEAHLWVSEALGRIMDQQMLSAQQLFGESFAYASALNGLVLEYSFTEKESGERYFMKVIRLDLKYSKRISTSDYNVMTMGM